ncbi:fungal-specific transcription factor domain protein [Aspergillus campestris IBT 28561]|uniref:Fungal-specific transcription factor domain protein n=1 Tax=Aspergillus campestris (strain IBT 28561) TaxID=1392248 RepID=A0A2I1DBP4_ASPC2|nr:fungal-specific transcription factor domain protein [Aspergillus campestris IBT 28561]PKY07295.1 fungal-specific transcription factor domain protein [Aspergillus campestris IBT 28561]
MNTFLDAPELRVSRPVAACSRCRTAKIKCDGKLPACSACERVGKATSCSGASDEFARGKERSYVASLEGHCERLEKRIAELRRRKELLSLGQNEVVRESSITSNSAAGGFAQGHRKEVSDIDDLVGDFGYLSVNATSRDFHGITSNASFANLLLSLSFAGGVPKSDSSLLPPRSDITPLLQHYFDRFFPQLPFFVETNFWTSVDTVYQGGGRFAKASDQWFLRMVLAVASGSLSSQAGDRSYQRAQSFLAGALPYADDVLRPGSIAGIQAIILLAQYALVDPQRFRSWYLVGMAARAIVDLGLHQDPSPEVVSNSEPLEIRRRVFHCAYCLDRGVSTALDRTYSLSDDSINVALPPSAAPIPSALTESNHIFQRSPEPAWHLVRIRRILSAAYQKRFFDQPEQAGPLPDASMWTLCAKAHEWLEGAPKMAPSHFPLIYRLEFLYTITVILSPSGDISTLCDYAKVFLFEHCLHYVAQLHRVWEDPKWLPLMTELDLQRAYQVGVRIVDILSQHHELLLSPSIPALPTLAHNVARPPLVDSEDRLKSHARAIDSLRQTQSILARGERRWETGGLLQKFQQISGSVQEQLLQPSLFYLAEPLGYSGDLTATESPDPTDSGYVAFGLGSS